jgi:hypothetical protein
MPNDHVYLLVAVDMSATSGYPVEMVNRLLRGEMVTDQFAVADVTDLVDGLDHAKIVQLMVERLG